ncbi:MAG: GDSL-type esterase/lipase family protein [Candidatus Rokuibacteriota bacterium]
MGSRRALALLAAVLLLLGAVWALWPRPARRLPALADSTGATIVFLGDSITHGHRLAQEIAFPYRLGQALGVRAINAGISGDTTEGGLQRIERDVLAHRPQVVVVALGVNDAFGRRPQDATVANLRTITQRIRAQGALVILLHTSVPGVAGDGNRRELREIARAEDATLVEDFLLGVVPQHTYDGLHPDAEGQALLAERLLPVLRQALGRP